MKVSVLCVVLIACIVAASARRSTLKNIIDSDSKKSNDKSMEDKAKDNKWPNFIVKDSKDSKLVVNFRSGKEPMLSSETLESVAAVKKNIRATAYCLLDPKQYQTKPDGKSFVLKAKNGETLGQSEQYDNAGNTKRAIESIAKAAVKWAGKCVAYLKDHKEAGKPKINTFEDKGAGHRFHVKGGNNEIFLRSAGAKPTADAAFEMGSEVLLHAMNPDAKYDLVDCKESNGKPGKMGLLNNADKKEIARTECYSDASKLNEFVNNRIKKIMDELFGMCWKSVIVCESEKCKKGDNVNSNKNDKKEEEEF